MHINELEIKIRDLIEDRNQKRERNDQLEVKCNDLLQIMRNNEISCHDLTLENKTLKAEKCDLEKEISSMKVQIEKLTDPIVVRLEKDGLVATY